MVDRELMANKVRELIEPMLKSRRVDLVELICAPGGGRITVRCLVDTAQGITLDELSTLNQSIGAILDEQEVISDRYLLEVSSPGLDRPLKTPLDFDRMIGRRLKVVTKSALDGSEQEVAGQLIGANEELITLRIDNGEKFQISLSDVTKAVQEVEL